MTDVLPMWFNAAALALALMCFASFTWAIVTLFKRNAQTPPPMMYALSVLGLLFFTIQVAALLFPQPNPSRIVSALGLVVYTASLALFWWAVPFARNAAFGIAFAGVMPARVVCEGPYRSIRHPFYASYLLFWVAGVLVSQRWWLVVSVIVMGAQYVAAIRQEERELLRGPFSRQYEEYVKRTGCLLPKLKQAEPTSRT